MNNAVNQTAFESHRPSLMEGKSDSNNNNNNNNNSNNLSKQFCDVPLGNKHHTSSDNWASPAGERRVSMSNAPPCVGRLSVQRSANGRQSFIPPSISAAASASTSTRPKKSPGRRWLSSLKLSVWITTVFTLVFSFFYFFLHVLLLVKVWDPVHEQAPDTNQLIAEISRELVRDRMVNVEDGEEGTTDLISSVTNSNINSNYEHTDDHRHSREKSIMSLTLILVLSFHSISFYLFSTTLASCIRTIDQFVLRSPPHDALDNLSIETLYYRLSGHHPPQAFESRSRARSRMDEEMGVGKSKRRSLMLSFFGLVLALLSLLVLVMVQLVFCIALYSPFMDLMDCLLLIFSCAIMCCSIGFIFAASYFHRKTLYY